MVHTCMVQSGQMHLNGQFTRNIILVFKSVRILRKIFIVLYTCLIISNEKDRICFKLMVYGICISCLTAGLAFYVLYKEQMSQVARRHLIMSIWLPAMI